MVRKVFPNAQVAHVWAAQSQDEGRSNNGQFYFHGGTIYSYRSAWPLAHIMPEALPDGRRLVIVNEDKYSVTTSAHLTDVRRALNGRSDRVVTTDCDTLRDYVRGWGLEADRRKAMFAAIVAQRVKALQDEALLYANVRKRLWIGWDDAGTQLADSEAQRIALISDDAILATAELLGVPRSEIPAYDLDAMRNAVRAAYAKHNDPKRVQAREKAAHRSCLVKLHGMVERFTSARREPWHVPSMRRADPRTSGVIAEALRAYPDEASRLMAKVQAELARREVDATHSALNPDAHSVMWRRVRGTHATKVITAEQWEAGASGSLNSSLTLVRREGAELVTSRGARVPFKRAVAAFLLAQDCRAKGEAWVSPPNHAFPIGAFQLDRIDAEGTLRAGCHTIGFETMLRLALREVPHLVKARYPVPALITA